MAVLVLAISSAAGSGEQAIAGLQLSACNTTGSAILKVGRMPADHVTYGAKPIAALVEAVLAGGARAARSGARS